MCASLHTGCGVADGERVISAIAGTGVEEMDKRVDKMCMVPRVPGAQYLAVGLDNYRLWAMHDSGSSYTLVSTGLCKELGLAVNTVKLPGSYRVADGTAHKFAGRLERQML